MDTVINPSVEPEYCSGCPSIECQWDQGTQMPPPYDDQLIRNMMMGRDTLPPTPLLWQALQPRTQSDPGAFPSFMNHLGGPYAQGGSLSMRMPLQDQQAQQQQQRSFRSASDGQMYGKSNNSHLLFTLGRQIHRSPMIRSGCPA
jgi:hypothetical protein